MKKLIFMLLAIALLLSLCACDIGKNAPIEAVSFPATITNIAESRITVTPALDSIEAKSADVIEVTTDGGVTYTDADGNAIYRSDLTIGQVVSITYDGKIQETSPASIAASDISVISEPVDTTPAGNTITFDLRGYPCKVTLPAAWGSICRYVRYRGGSGVEFVSVNNRAFGGVAFAIWALDSEQLQAPDIFANCNGEPNFIDSDKQGGIYFYLVHPYTAIQYDPTDPALTEEYTTIANGAEDVVKTFAWKSPEDKSETEKLSQELKELLYTVSDTVDPGSAGSSLSAANCAGLLLDWRTTTALSDEDIRTGVTQWFKTLADSRAELFPQQLECVYSVVPALFSEDADELLYAAGYQEPPQLWNREHAESFFTILFECIGQ